VPWTFDGESGSVDANAERGLGMPLFLRRTRAPDGRGFGP
jgi:hypothetical protein